MKLWQLQQFKIVSADITVKYSMIVRADTKQAARAIASESMTESRKRAWSDWRFASCEELITNGKPEILREWIGEV